MSNREEEKEMTLRRINETDEIKVGDILYDKHPNFPQTTKCTVTRITKTMIVTNMGLRYRKEGYLVGDEFYRCRLYTTVAQ